MPVLYLNNTATASPFPTTSKKLVTSAPSSEVSLGPGEFDSGFPGLSDAGQWNPSSAIGDTTAAAEIDNTGIVPGVARQGWLWDVDNTGYTLPAGTWTEQLRLRANQGADLSARVAVRATIVTGLAGAWVTVANLLTTEVTGATSTTVGQTGWRNSDARITVAATAANHAVNIATSGTSAAHTFASGERLLIEEGFCDANSTGDRTWRLDYNQGSSFITIPDLIAPPVDYPGTQGESAAATETSASVLGFVSTQAESVTASEAASGLAAFLGTQAETVAASEATSSLAAFLTTQDESVAATETSASVLGFVSAQDEGAAGTDAQAALAAFLAGQDEGAAGTDAQAGLASFLGTQDESVAGTDAQAGLAAFLATQTETAAASEVSSSLAAFLSGQDETAAAGETSSAVLTLAGATDYPATQEETVAAGESSSAVLTVAPVAPGPGGLGSSGLFWQAAEQKRGPKIVHGFASGLVSVDVTSTIRGSVVVAGRADGIAEVVPVGSASGGVLVAMGRADGVAEVLPAGSASGALVFAARLDGSAHVEASSRLDGGAEEIDATGSGDLVIEIPEGYELEIEA